MYQFPGNCLIALFFNYQKHNKSKQLQPIIHQLNYLIKIALEIVLL